MSDAVIINIHEDINLVEVIIGSSVMRMASIREYVHQLMLIDRRKGTERCLTCGSTDHQSFRGGCDGRLSALNWDSQLAADNNLACLSPHLGYYRATLDKQVIAMLRFSFDETL